MSVFQRATREQAKLRMALVGPAGSGKTYTALAIATALGQRIALVDTEHGSAAKYAGGRPFDFDTVALSSFSPARYVEAIQAAEAEGHDVVILDSLSHAWQGKDGALEKHDEAAQMAGENRFTAWRHVTPLHNELIETILQARLHVIATMRAKTAYEIEKDERGRSVPKKIGLAPIQRDGVEYEFDVVGDITVDHALAITKTRCDALDGRVFKKPGADLAGILLDWLGDGAPPPPPASAELHDEIAALIVELYPEENRQAVAVEKIEGQYGTPLHRLNDLQATDCRDRLLGQKQKLAEAQKAAEESTPA